MKGFEIFKLKVLFPVLVAEGTITKSKKMDLREELKTICLYFSTSDSMDVKYINI